MASQVTCKIQKGGSPMYQVDYIVEVSHCLYQNRSKRQGISELNTIRLFLFTRM
ncbi:hypothetical protein MKW98_030896, partial [Papaver atlanticum]